MRRLLLFLVAGGALTAADLASRVPQVIEASPAARAAFWGVRVDDLETGRTLVSINADRFFVPASNTKLFTTALGLVRLGPDYRYETLVLSERPPDGAGTVAGIRLVGGGDPNLSARAIPYRTGPIEGNALAAIEELAARVVERGVRRIEGDIVGDDTAYVWEPFPAGWAADDGIWEYGASVSALTVNDNAFTLRVRPGARAGDPAAITLAPPLEFYTIDNRVRTTAGGERRVRIAREPGSGQLRVWGELPAGDRGSSEILGVHDPALYAARAFYDALARRGVAIAGRAGVRHVFPNQVEDLRNGPAPGREPGFELARRVSPPLIEDLRVTDKVSQNLHAELTLRAVALARRKIGSREAGLEELKAFLDEIGVEREAYAFHDGSGLARLNLVTPATVVKLLRYMHTREGWLSLLPVGGRDGTLETRFKGSAAAGRILAKTGTLSHVSALSGYAERRNGAPLAFAILVNNYNAPSGEVRAVIDTICSLMVE
jgi:D-alanyl-D-alanine carboxypeptidase/D-alanyl-D-alanine-endopeptidase (penicillin-binding protein 4)